MPKDPFQMQNQSQSGWNSYSVAPTGGSTPPSSTGTSGSAPSGSYPGASGYQNQTTTPQQVQQQPGSSQGGTGFVNLSRILGMNSAAGAQMGDQLANSAGQSANKAQQEVQGAYNQFATNVKNGYQSPSLGAMNSLQSGLDQGNAFVKQWSGQDLKQPTYQDEQGQLSNLQGKMTQLQALINGIKNYQPQQAEDWTKAPGFSGVSSDLASAQDKLNGLRQPGGIQGAIQQQYGNTGAQSALDAMFVGGNNQAINNVENKYNSGGPFSNLSGLLGYYGQQAQGAVANQQNIANSDLANMEQMLKQYQDLYGKVQGTYDPTFNRGDNSVSPNADKRPNDPFLKPGVGGPGVDGYGRGPAYPGRKHG